MLGSGKDCAKLSRLFNRRGVRVAGATGVVLAVAATASYAVIPSEEGEVAFCYKTGGARIVDVGEPCKNNESRVVIKSATKVGSSELVDGSVTTPKLADGAVTEQKLAPGAVTTSTIVADAITAPKIAPDAVTTLSIAPEAVTTLSIAPDAVTAVKLAPVSVTAPKIAPEAVTTTSIASDAVTAVKLAPVSVTAASIAPDAVTPPKIASGAVTRGKLAASAVDAESIASDAVTATKLAPGSVTRPSIANNAVGSAQIAPASITGSDIDYVRVQATSASDGANFKSVAAQCPEGKVASGGGFQLGGTPEGMSRVTVTSSQPFTPPGQQATTWTASAREISGLDAGNWELTVFAVCT